MLHDAAVIGAGPAGITAALYLVRSGASVAIIEHLATGGQILTTAEIDNYPGFPGSVKGWELADLFDAHLSGYSIGRMHREVVAVDSSGGRFFHVRMDEEKSLDAKAVIVCSGVRHRKLNIPGEEEFAGRGVSYCAVCDGNFYRNRDVAVLGGGNSALEEALYLSRIASKVHLIHRRGEFRGEQFYQDKIRATENIEFVPGSLAEEIRGNASGVTSILTRDRQTGESREIAVDGVFIYVGMDPVSGFLPEDVRRDNNGFVITDAEMNTSIPGMFAAGDVRSKHCRQVCTAVGDGATAAAAALSYLEHWNA